MESKLMDHHFAAVIFYLEHSNVKLLCSPFKIALSSRLTIVYIGCQTRRNATCLHCQNSKLRLDQTVK